jgi:hypothetical protein
LEFFLLATASRQALEPNQLSIQWTPGVLSPRVKRLDREPDHTIPSNAEVKNELRYTFTPPYVFMAWYLVKHREKFTFLVLPIIKGKR